MTSKSVKSYEQSADVYEYLLGGNDIRDDERGGFYLETDVSPRVWELNIQLGDGGACPRLVAVLRKIYASAIQTSSRAVPAERNWFIIINGHPSFLLRLRPGNVRAAVEFLRAALPTRNR